MTPGDVISIPEAWYHTVHNIGITVVLSEHARLRSDYYSESPSWLEPFDEAMTVCMKILSQELLDAELVDRDVNYHTVLEKATPALWFSKGEASSPFLIGSSRS